MRRAALGIMVAACVCRTALPANESKAPSELEVLTSTSEAEPKDSVRAIVARRGQVTHAAITLIVEPPAIVYPAANDQSCKTVTQGSQTLALAANAPDPLVVCLSAPRDGKSRLLATAVGADGSVQTAQSDTIRFAQKSIGSNPALMALLTAAIGFIFGLGSSWFSAFTETYRNRRKTRAEAEKFLAETFYPEIRNHARAIAQYRSSADAARKNLAANPLPQTAATVAYSDDRFAQLAQYFASLRSQSLKDRLVAYDASTQNFNNEANRLLGTAAVARDTTQQDANAAALQRELTALGFLPP